MNRWDAFYTHARMQHKLTPEQARQGLTRAVRHYVKQANTPIVAAAGLSPTAYLSAVVTTAQFHAVYLYCALTAAGRLTEALKVWKEHQRQEVLTAAEALAAVPAAAPFGNARTVYGLTNALGLDRDLADRTVLRAAYHISLGHPISHLRHLPLPEVLARTTEDELRTMLRHAAIVEERHSGELFRILAD